MNNRLKELRGAQSMKTIASSIGITVAHYAYIESGKRIPSLPVALRLAGYFDVDLEEIFEPSAKQQS